MTDAWDRLRAKLPISLADKLDRRLDEAMAGEETSRPRLELVLSRGHLVDIVWDPNERIPVKNGTTRP